MAILTTLESFTGGADGGSPGYGALLMDANGDLFGTTTLNGGTVFELVHTGTGYTMETLVSFDPTSTVNGNTPFAGLTADANGNLFGVTQAGGASGAGTVFELVNTGSGYSLTTLASFSGANGSNPMGTLAADAGGNLFGTTQAGGATNSGTVFEMVHSASGYSLQTLYQFSFTDGEAPTGPLTIDANGNLFGTTLQGGTGTPADGTVFELVHGAAGYTYHSLANFNGSNGSLLYAGVTADAQGDLFGATYMGGANGYGTVYELVNTGSGYTMRTLATFDNTTTGGYAIGGLTINAQGDVFGTAFLGGPGGFGTVFELVHGATGYTFQTLYAFSANANGGLPEGGLVLDAAGNLYGTTDGGGLGYGTVFELGAAPPNDGGAAEQANLALKINGGSANPIGAALAGHVGFTIAGLQPGDTGVVTFTDAANHTVTVYVAAGVTQYAANLSSLTDGVVSASLQVATNSVGNVFTPVAGNVVTLDTVAPTQPGAPADAAVHNGVVNAAGDVATQTIGGMAEAGAGVTIYDNGVLVASVTADASTGVWSYQIGTLANGTSHSYAVTATDAAGNVSPMSAPLTFTVEATPLAQPAAPSDPSVINGWVNAAHDTFAQSIGGTTEAGATVAVFDNGTQVATVTADNTGAWTYQVGHLINGSAHSYAVIATDAFGNVSPMSPALSFTVDTAAPAQPGAPADAAVINGWVNAAHDTSTQTITGTTEAGATVAVYDNGALVTTVTAGNTGAWSYQVGALADGSSHSFAVTATDAAGNVSAASAPLSFTVDATPPTPFVQNVTGAAKGMSVVSGVSEAGSTVTLSDGGLQIGVATADSSGAWSVTAKLNGGAVHQFTETAVDLAGNAGASTGSAYWANPGNKTFVGGTGDDVFIGQKGDTFTGGAGHNHYVFDPAFGTQTVTNFTHGNDQIWFDHTVFGSAAQAIAHGRQSGANTVIVDAWGDQLVLQNVQWSSLQTGDFHLF